MRYAAWGILLASLLTAVAVLTTSGLYDRMDGATAGAQAAEPSTEKPGGLPPLKVDTNAPLLLDSPVPKEKLKPAKGPVADNSACHVCHTNYEEDTLAVQHARANVGCVKCHGLSLAHRNDEDNITPPDTMYAADVIEPACLQCHETHDAPAKKVLARWKERCPAKENPEDLVCTDCHGEHRLKFRTVWWDKKTGKLANRKGERIKVAPDYTKKPGSQVAPKPPAPAQPQEKKEPLR